MTVFDGYERFLPWQERAGFLRELTRENDVVLATVGKTRVKLPAEMEKVLKPLIGQSIAILRTDLSDEPYMVRAITVKQNKSTNEEAI